MSRQVVVTIAGSRKLDGVPGPVLEFMSQLPMLSKILLRAPALKQPARFERIVAKVALELWLEREWVMPVLTAETRSGDPRGVVFERDVYMVSRSDCVLAFFAEEVMSGGTEHIVEKAMDQEVPVYSYGLRDGHFVRIGEWDPRGLWADQAPIG